MAEAVFQATAKSQGYQIHVDSAGTGAYHEGDPPDSRTMKVLRDHGIKNYRHAARKVQLSDYKEFDYILAMDDNNLQYLRRMRDRSVRLDNYAETKRTAEVMLFGDFGGQKGEEVADPYYGARDGFTMAYEQVKRFSEGFIQDILKSDSSAVGAS